MNMPADNHRPSNLLQRANTVLYQIVRRVGEHGYKPEEVGEPKGSDHESGALKFLREDELGWSTWGSPPSAWLYVQ